MRQDLAPRADGSLDRIGAEALDATRRLFWQNVVRETLNGLAVLCQTRPELFDGRFAVLTTQRERIPIGSVTPVFACTVPGTAWEREASVAVQCSVFRIGTPDGEVFTLPVHEIRAIHELTPELLERLDEAVKAENEASQRRGDEEQPAERLPFGFAAFTGLPRLPTGPAPMHPME